MAELLAADALAGCWSGIPEVVRKPSDTSYRSSFMLRDGFGDPVISTLLTKMDSAICPEHWFSSTNWGARPAHEVFEGWISARRDPACSADITTGQSRTLELSEPRASLSQTAGLLPSGIPASARREAEAELAYADLYLCMTQRLVEHTQSSFVFDASAEDVLKLYDLARNRALLTVFQYSLIAKVFALPSTTLSGLSEAGYGTVAALKAWANNQSEAAEQAAGRDFAMAIDLLTSLTEKQVRLLRRDASRQVNAGGADAQANILRALYGDATPQVSRVTQDLSEPEVGVLLGLARKADALDLFVNVDNSSQRVVVDRERAAASLLRAAERQLRLQRCPTDHAGCGTVDANQDPDEFDLFTRFNIDRRHALKLIDALSEALLGPGAYAGSDEARAALPASAAGPEVGTLQKLVGAYADTCGLFSTGAVACWGSGMGLPADGGPECSGPGCTSPSRWVMKANGSLLTEVVDIAATGGDVACALDRSGDVYCWGNWEKRGPGYGLTPVAGATKVTGLPSSSLDPVRRISAGMSNACAVTVNGALYCWGYGGRGVLGNGTRDGTCAASHDCGAGTCVEGTCRNTVAYEASHILSNMADVALGMEHACALSKAGALYCWGSDRWGMLGRVPTSERQQCGDVACLTRPAPVSLPDKLVALALGHAATCVLNAKGDAHCWGGLGYVSNPSAPAEPSCRDCSRAPVRVLLDGQPMTNIHALSSGVYHLCAERGRGEVYCWGWNGLGQLGQPARDFAAPAVRVAPGPFTAVANGDVHSCALSYPSGARCWGEGSRGALGNGPTTNTSTPVAMVMPSDPPPYSRDPKTDIARVQEALSAANPPFHLLGTELLSDAAGVRIHLDQNFQLVTLDSHELQARATLRHVPPITLDVRGPARGQGFLYRRFLVPSGYSKKGVSASEWGSVPTLALARESIVQASAPFYMGASPALELLEKSIGVRSTILRKRTEVRDATAKACTGECLGSVCMFPPPDLPSDTVDGVCREIVAVQGGARTAYELSVVTTADDTVRTVAYGAQVRNAASKALQPSGPDNADLLATQRALRLQERFGRNMRTTRLMLKSPASVFFEVPATPRDQGGFQLIFDGSIRELGPATDFSVLDGAISTRGGALNALAAESVEVHPTNWSMPRYDAYGLPTDWVPSADPSLLGSNGEEPYLYFLRLAEKVAREATKAIEDAAETTRQEEIDAQTLAAAQAKGAQLREQENKLLCGAGSCSEVTWTVRRVVDDIGTGCSVLKLPAMVLPSQDLIAARAEAVKTCESRGSALQAMMAEGIKLPTEVWLQRDREVPSFAGQEGSELGKALLGTWSALRRLRDAHKTALATIQSSEANLAAARAEQRAARDGIAEASLGVLLQGISLGAQRDALAEKVRAVRSQEDELQTTVDRVCTEEGFDSAIDSGYSFSHAHSSKREYFDEKTTVAECIYRVAGVCLAEQDVTYQPGGWKFSTKYDEGARSWSKGSLLAWQERCDQLHQDLAAAKKRANDGTLSEAQALIDQIDDLSARQRAAGVVAAMSRAVAASERVEAAKSAASLSHQTSLGTVQEARAALLLAAHEIDLLEHKLDLATARYTLDQSLSEAEIATRHKLRRRYQGFAQWRAEAMAESARRTAVAARRAIESRFVVDLSKLGNEEPFVAAPALWADDVYDRDLKPPAAVGVTLSQGSADDQQYSNKLLDYVSNLELFVAGYSIDRPTSTARSDAEVLTLPAPSAFSSMDVGADTYAQLDPGTLGWKFWCENTGDYVVNPASMLFGEVDESLLTTMCDGQPPSRAVLTFAMDPWGRVGGNPFSKPYVARHNARWQRFALNLVGTGIRECEYARDPDQCYAEPFLRYNLRHVGPAWVTSHELSWRALEIPSAVIEDGKALAIEEWLDPVSRGWNVGEVQAVARTELAGRPLGGVYELTLALTPDVRLSRIERIQLLTSVDYWVRQH